MDMSNISVLMSVYKSERPEYLDRSIQSVWPDQSLKPDEIVLVEDGPIGEDLQDVIDKWEKCLGDRLVVITNERNLGLTKSLNKGLKVAKCDYIARMDSDDISTPVRFEKQKDYLDNNPEVTVVGGCLQEFDSEHDNLGVRRYPLTDAEVRNYIYRASPLAHPAVMMRKSMFDNGMAYDESYRTSQDIALWFDVLCAGYKIANIEDVVILFRRDGDMFKRRSKSKARNEFIIYMSGIRRLYGLFTWRYIYPFVRFCFRMMPLSVVKFAYSSKIREKVLN